MELKDPSLSSLNIATEPNRKQWNLITYYRQYHTAQRRRIFEFEELKVFFVIGYRC